MIVWRLCSRLHLNFDGEGARRVGGRWNRKGISLVYTSATLSLAAQELFVHVDPDTLPSDLVSVSALIPDSLEIKTISAKTLPKDWRRYPASEELAEIGSAWALANETAVLAVPSAVIPQEANYLLNPTHTDFRMIEVGQSQPFTFDARMWKGR